MDDRECARLPERYARQVARFHRQGEERSIAPICRCNNPTT